MKRHIEPRQKCQRVVMNGAMSMASHRRLVAERERDIAIEEAAMEALEARRLREEITALRREKAEWEASRDEWKRYQEQLLWNVGAIAETIWHKMQDDREHISVEEARLLALGGFKRVPLKSDAQLYEEMHDLYAKIARMEAQHTQLLHKIQEMKRLNDELAVSSQMSMKCDSRNAETQTQRACELMSNDARDSKMELNSNHADKAMRMLQETRGIVFSSQNYDRKDGHEDDRNRSGVALPFPSPDAATTQQDGDACAAILQAQLTTYISFFNRHHLPSATLKSTDQIER